MPSAQCLPKKTRDRKAIIAARKKFETSCGKASMSLDMYAHVVIEWPRTSSGTSGAPLTSLNAPWCGLGVVRERRKWPQPRSRGPHGRAARPVRVDHGGRVGAGGKRAREEGGAP